MQSAPSTDLAVEDQIAKDGSTLPGAAYLRGRAIRCLRQVAENQMLARKRRDSFFMARVVRPSARAVELGIEPFEEDIQARRDVQKAAAARIRAEAEEGAAQEGDQSPVGQLNMDVEEESENDEAGQEGKEDHEDTEVEAQGDDEHDEAGATRDDQGSV